MAESDCEKVSEIARPILVDPHRVTVDQSLLDFKQLSWSCEFLENRFDVRHSARLGGRLDSRTLGPCFCGANP